MLSCVISHIETHVVMKKKTFMLKRTIELMMMMAVMIKPKFWLIATSSKTGLIAHANSKLQGKPAQPYSQIKCPLIAYIILGEWCQFVAQNKIPMWYV